MGVSKDQAARFQGCDTGEKAAGRGLDSITIKTLINSPSKSEILSLLFYLVTTLSALSLTRKETST